MELNIKKAFGSPFSDEKWYIKLIFPSIMAIFSLSSNVLVHEHKMAMFFILCLVLLLPGFVLSGFFLQFVHNEIHDETPLLPNLKSQILQYLKYGAKLLGLVLYYMITLGLIMCAIILILNIFIGIVIGICSALLHLQKPVMILLSTITSLIISIPIIIVWFSYFILLTGAFADNFNFKEAKNYKRIFSLLSKVKSEIAIYIVCLFIAIVIITLLPFLPKITLILAPIITAIIQFVLINLKAQVYKIAKGRLEIETIASQDA